MKQSISEKPEGIINIPSTLQSTYHSVRSNPPSSSPFPPVTTDLNLLVGDPGNATLHHESSPPVFYLRYGQLWQYNNDTNIMPMNVLNVSSSTDTSLQLVVGRREEGVHGVWTWKGTQLFYEHSSGSNQGIYYSCPTESGYDGVFIFLKT